MKTLKNQLVIFVQTIVVIALSSIWLSLPAMADTPPVCTGPVSENSNCGAGDPASGGTDNSGSDSTGSSNTATTTPVTVNPDCNDPSASGLQNCLKHNKIITDLNTIVDFLSAGVGIVVVGSIILGGIQYSMAGGSPDGVSKAKKRITDAIIALVAFIFIFAFLQWIIPGGI